MDIERARERLTGCYVTIPTMFHDEDLSLNLAGMQEHVRFLIDGGLGEGNCVVLSGGGAGFQNITYCAKPKRIRRSQRCRELPAPSQ